MHRTGLLISSVGKRVHLIAVLILYMGSSPIEKTKKDYKMAFCDYCEHEEAALYLRKSYHVKLPNKSWICDLCFNDFDYSQNIIILNWESYDAWIYKKTS